MHFQIGLEHPCLQHGEIAQRPRSSRATANMGSDAVAISSIARRTVANPASRSDAALSQRKHRQQRYPGGDIDDALPRCIREYGFRKHFRSARQTRHRDGGRARVTTSR
jgi:hypothetical protein